MKKIFILFILIFTSCENDYLDVVPDNIATIDLAFNTRSTALNFLSTCYTYIPEHAHVEQNFSMLAGDEVWYFLADRLEKALQGRDWQCILKLTPPETANQYENLTDNQAVKQVVFLSGGYELEEACWRLIRNDNVTASFSRALTEHLYHDLDDEAFDEQLSYNIEDIVEACSIEL